MSTEETAGAIIAFLRQSAPAMEAYLERLVLAESPSTRPEAQAEVLSILNESLVDLDFDVALIEGLRTGGHLLARQGSGATNSTENGQLLLGHCDTVWPVGTLASMPFQVKREVIRGPGVFDMKGGLTQMVFALRALRELELTPRPPVVVFVNSDEEIGSFESEPHIRALAQQVRRVFVLEPALGQDGRLKTARKGVGRFEVVVEGKAAHAGLDPGAGVSAILELSYLIQALHSLNDPGRGISVNVGIVEGGLGSNVIAPEARALVDVRVSKREDAEWMEAAIKDLRPVTPGTFYRISGAIGRLPMERTERNQRLWALAKEMAAAAGFDLDQGLAGGASDGNFTSRHVATLDGLGAVGDGAHASHEFIFRDRVPERAALLALMLLSPGAAARR
jgi:glutamate carboxypeptidase